MTRRWLVNSGRTGRHTCQVCGQPCISSTGGPAPPGELEVTGNLFSPACPTRELLDRIGDKWTSMLIKVLADVHPGELGFAELRRRTPGVSHKMLSQTLQSLRRDGLVTRRVEPTVPPRVYYALTDLGVSLDAPLAAVRAWAEHHMAAVGRARRRHDDQVSADLTS